MDLQLIRKLIFYAIDDTSVVEKYLGWSQLETKAKLIYPNLYKAIQESEVSSETDDLKLINIVFCILERQSAATLKLKVSNLKPPNSELWFNNLPDAISDADALDWAREPYWNEYQAALLSLGLAPRFTADDFLKEYEGILSFVSSGFLEEVNKRRTLITKHSYDSNLDGASPYEFLIWFKKLEFSFPDALERAILRIHDPNTRAPETKLSTVERETLLKLVAAMSIRGYKFDPNAKRNTATQDVMSDLEFLGIGLDSKTVLKWLREASSLVKVSAYK